MARAQATDYLHNFRFHVRATPLAGLGSDPLQPGGEPSSGRGTPGTDVTPEAGFQSVVTPEYTVESTEYREGLRTYAEKYPGIPTTNDLTFTRGVARLDTAFYNWVIAAIEGREYRTDLTIFHALRGGRSQPFNPDADFTQANSRRYLVRNAFAMRVKVAADMDSGTSDISLSEIDVSYERFDIATPPAPA